MTTIKCFGMLSEKTGTSAFKQNIPDGSSIKDFKKLILEEHPVLQSLTFKIAVNQKITSDDFIIPDNAEIALLPPFSGG